MRQAKIPGALLLATLFICPVFAEPISADVPGIERLSLAFREVVKKVKPAVVFIEAQQARRGPAAGSGVIIDGRNGYVLTANHVVEEAGEVKVRLADGREFKAVDIRTDPTIDVAIVKIEADNLPEAELGDSDELEVGDWVLAIGSPLGRILENSVSAGIVSARGRRVGILSGRVGIEDFIQTDAVINKGNSGGPLVNIKGRIVGINSNIISSTGMYAGLGFAVPSNLIKPTVEKLIKEGKVVRGWLGVTISSLGDLKEDDLVDIPDDVEARGGAYVVNVLPDGPAEKAGIEKEDIIIAIDGQPVDGPAQLIDIISSAEPGTRVKCRIWRAGKEKTIRVNLGERPTELPRQMHKWAARPTPKTQAFKKLGLAVSDFKGVVANLSGISELKAVEVDYVKPGSLADQYGITAGDIITEVDGYKIENTVDFEKKVKKVDVKKGVELKILGAFGEYKLIIKSGAD